MKELLILRHAKSSRDNPALEDHQRPLNQRGLKTAPLMGDLIKRKKLCPEKIVASDALRARQTAVLFAEHCGYAEEKIEYTRKVYDAAPADIIRLIKSFDNRHGRVMIVGHNPAFEDLCARLCGTFEVFPTATVAYLKLPINDWNEISLKTKGELAGIWRPKEIQ